MKERKLKEYFENLLTAEELSKDLEGSQKQTSYDVTSIYIEHIEDGEFEISKSHLIKVCDDFISGQFSAYDVNTIASALSFSEFFMWDGNNNDGKLIGEVIFDWDNPELGFDLTQENFKHWKEYLERGVTQYLTKEALKNKFRGMKKNDSKRNGI